MNHVHCWKVLTVLGALGTLAWNAPGDLWARTYYVALDGQDAVSCEDAQQRTAPKHTLGNAMSCLTEPGDILMIREGRYAETLTIPEAIEDEHHQASGLPPRIISAYEKERVVLAPAEGEAVIHLPDSTVQSLQLVGLHVDATGTTTGLHIEGPHTVIAQDVTISGATGPGIHLRAGAKSEPVPAPRLRFTEVELHHNGGGGLRSEGMPFILEHSVVHDNGQGGIHLTGESVTSSNPTRIWNNHLWHNGLVHEGWGIRIAHTHPTLVYGNVLWQHARGLSVQESQVTFHLVAHNTVMGPGHTGIHLEGPATRVRVHNNISVGHQTNLEMGPTVQAQVSHTLMVDPGVVDWATGEAHLLPTSAAIDAGLPLLNALTDPALTPVLDPDGHPRPLGEGWDIGAYEYVADPQGAPTADFVAMPTSGVPPITVSFLDHSTGPIDRWEWQFGDGSTSVDRHPTHEYRQAGAFPITLTVTGPGGTDTLTRTAYLTVGGTPLQADFSVTPAHGPAPLTVQLRNTSFGSIQHWEWRLGDGTTSHDRHPVHTFAQPGVYTPQLTIRGPAGQMAVSQPGLQILVTPRVSTVLLREDFADTALTEWEVVDEGQWQGPSQWVVRAGTLQQLRNIWSPPASPTALAHLGTMLWYRPGQTWTNYRLTADLQSKDDDTMGVIMRYQDAKNYYRFSWDCERGIRRLVKRVNGQFHLLAEERVPYQRGHLYHLQLDAFGDVLHLTINDEVLFGGPLVDDSLATGSVGFYTWLNNATQVSHVEVRELVMATGRKASKEDRP